MFAQVLHRFLTVFSTFDWDNMCLSVNGPIPLNTFPNPKREYLVPVPLSYSNSGCSAIALAVSCCCGRTSPSSCRVLRVLATVRAIPMHNASVSELLKSQHTNVCMTRITTGLQWIATVLSTCDIKASSCVAHGEITARTACLEVPLYLQR